MAESRVGAGRPCQFRSCRQDWTEAAGTRLWGTEGREHRTDVGFRRALCPEGEEGEGRARRPRQLGGPLSQPVGRPSPGCP